MPCEDQIYSNDYFDLIIEHTDARREGLSAYCIQPIDSLYDVLYIPREGYPALSVSDYSYTAIPRCYTLLDQTAMEASGILRVQNQPTLSLKGQGVLIGFVDTGIDYTNPLFQKSDGSSRIISIWDQTIPNRPPAGYWYGTEYQQSEISQALLEENPYESVPTRDENGHGTYLAGVAAGNEDYANNFIGAAPEAEIIAVKLKPAKQYLRDYYFIPEGAVAYEETDIMAGISYIWRYAALRGMPVAICVALGTNMGSHSGNSPLARYLSSVGVRQMCAVVTAAGNEANARHHYFGTVDTITQQDNVEINVESGVTGFTAEVWARAPELYSVTVTSPTGERVPKLSPRRGEREVYRFVFEDTTVSIDYRIVGADTGDQLIYIRFERPTRGVWSIQVYGDNYLGGNFHIWLPVRAFLSGEVFFIRSNPDVTITVPSNASGVMTVGGYNARDGSLYIDSGRGYTLDGEIKPDFTAPAVNVSGPSIGAGAYETRTGTSAAAAVTTGASALFLEWAVNRENDEGVNSVEIRNYFIRGANRDAARSYPSREWGYGKLDLYQVFETIRG